MDLTNRSALVTGSSRGIGAAIARKLASRGAEVLVHGNKNSSTASQVVEQIKQTGGRASLVLADFSSPETVTALFDSIGDKAAHLDILVNNAGIFEAPPEFGADANSCACPFAIRKMRRKHAKKSMGTNRETDYIDAVK
jgi:3-oxoacyl-[acyl-carrier protein] reductase